MGDPDCINGFVFVPLEASGYSKTPKVAVFNAFDLSFVNSDLHPAFKPLFGPGNFIEDETQHDALRATARKRLRGLFERADKQLADRPWLAGFRSFADPYFYITLRWAAGAKIDLGGLDNIAAYKTRMDADAGVQAALKAEGLS